jgi:AcrR family transcriptional regulator
MTGDDWRTRKKDTTRRLIQEHALRLFAEKGYDATTVEEIATAAGVSHMTFFRYFPRKYSVVETREYDPMIEEFIVARPEDEPALVAIGAAIRVSLAAILPRDRDRWLARVRLVMSTPDLFGRHWVAQRDTRDLFARALARRSGLAQPDFVCTVQAATAVAPFDTALQVWAQADDGDLPSIVDAAFAAAAAATELSAEAAVIGRR